MGEGGALTRAVERPLPTHASPEMSIKERNVNVTGKIKYTLENSKINKKIKYIYFYLKAQFISQSNEFAPR